LLKKDKYDENKDKIKNLYFGKMKAVKKQLLKINSSTNEVKVNDIKLADVSKTSAPAVALKLSENNKRLTNLCKCRNSTGQVTHYEVDKKIINGQEVAACNGEIFTEPMTNVPVIN